MSRTIKFRAWDGKTMLSDVLVMNGKYCDMWVNLETGSPSPHLLDFPLMQYTGLHDKNGVEVFEGDVVQKTNAQTGRNMAKSVITYNINSARFNGLSFGTSTDIEVIGNIYSNPELIDGPRKEEN